MAATPVDVLVTKWGIFDWLVTEIPKAITWPIVALIALFAILRSRRALAWLLPVFGRFQSLKLGTSS